MAGRPFDGCKGPLQCNDDKTDYNSQSLDDRDSDDKGNEYTNAGMRLNTTGVARYTANEVPEKLAEEYGPEACPNCVCTGSKGDIATQLMPDELAHLLK